MDSSPPRSLADWLALLEKRHPRTIDLGLERCGEVWHQLGKPQPAPRTIVVAGTNGKGSVVATICALLDSLGYRHGSYTSPHLLEFNERISLGGQPVSDRTLLRAFERVEAARGDVSLTFFEFTTLAAFCVLEQGALDFAVLEVGLGGRLDAVNLLDADCAVITPVGLDHQEYLGPDRESIGREKAGIMRPGQPVVCGDREPPQTVLAAAREGDASLRRLGVDFTHEASASGVRFRYGDIDLDLPPPVLDGPHQLDNQAAALAAVLTLLPDAAQQPGVLANGLRSVRVRGRMERLAERPALWVDVGHNPMAARTVAATLRDSLARESIPRCLAVLAMLADKDAELNGHVPHVFERVPEALAAALAAAGKDGAVLVFGSFQTAADAVRYWMLLESSQQAGKG
ncbi:MAG: bifunctional folylpolyglutamate synthase/dihydrofolate synthase [Gammaproteobacteria bacterium]